MYFFLKFHFKIVRNVQSSHLSIFKPLLFAVNNRVLVTELPPHSRPPGSAVQYQSTEASVSRKEVSSALCYTNNAGVVYFKREKAKRHSTLPQHRRKQHNGTSMTMAKKWKINKNKNAYALIYLC